MNWWLESGLLMETTASASRFTISRHLERALRLMTSGEFWLQLIDYSLLSARLLKQEASKEKFAGKA